MVGGDLDSLTPLPDARVFGPTLGANVRVVDAAQHRPRDLGGRHVPRRGRALRAARSSARSCARPAAATLGGCAARSRPAHRRRLPADAGRRRAGDARVRARSRASAARRAATVAAGALADATMRRCYSGGARAAPGCAAAASPRSGDALVRLALARRALHARRDRQRHRAAGARATARARHADGALPGGGAVAMHAGLDAAQPIRARARRGRDARDPRRPSAGACAARTRARRRRASRSRCASRRALARGEQHGGAERRARSVAATMSATST